MQRIDNLLQRVFTLNQHLVRTLNLHCPEGTRVEGVDGSGKKFTTTTSSAVSMNNQLTVVVNLANREKAVPVLRLKFFPEVRMNRHGPLVPMTPGAAPAEESPARPPLEPALVPQAIPLGDEEEAALPGSGSR